MVGISIPASAATLAICASVAFQAAFASSVTSRNVRRSSGFSVANFSVTEITSKEPMPASFFCCELMIAVPTSPAAFADAPPKIQAMSTEPSASDTAPSAGAWSTIVIVEMSTFRAAICLRNAKSAIVLSGTAAVLPSSSEAFDESMPRPFFTKQSFAS